MKAVALLLAIAAHGVDFKWERSADEQIEYTIQLEPELIDVLAGGDSVISNVPPTAMGGRRLRIQVAEGGANTLRAGWPKDQIRSPLIGATSQRVQQLANGKLEYLVQVDSDALGHLQQGRPIIVAFGPKAAEISRIRITAGKEPLPEDSARPLTLTPPPTISPLGSPTNDPSPTRLVNDEQMESAPRVSQPEVRLSSGQLPLPAPPRKGGEQESENVLDRSWPPRSSSAPPLTGETPRQQVPFGEGVNDPPAPFQADHSRSVVVNPSESGPAGRWPTGDSSQPSPRAASPASARELQPNAPRAGLDRTGVSSRQGYGADGVGATAAETGFPKRPAVSVPQAPEYSGWREALDAQGQAATPRVARNTPDAGYPNPAFDQPAGSGPLLNQPQNDRSNSRSGMVAGPTARAPGMSNPASGVASEPSGNFAANPAAGSANRFSGTAANPAGTPQYPAGQYPTGAMPGGQATPAPGGPVAANPTPAQQGWNYPPPNQPYPNASPAGAPPAYQVASQTPTAAGPPSSSFSEKPVVREASLDRSQARSSLRSDQEATEDELAKPWLPLMLTMLALFASAGGNIFLAWMAWDYVDRYRNLADEIRQVRTSDAD